MYSMTWSNGHARIAFDLGSMETVYNLVPPPRYQSHDDLGWSVQIRCHPKNGDGQTGMQNIDGDILKWYTCHGDNFVIIDNTRSRYVDNHHSRYQKIVRMVTFSIKIVSYFITGKLISKYLFWWISSVSTNHQHITKSWSVYQSYLSDHFIW